MQTETPSPSAQTPIERKIRDLATVLEDQKALDIWVHRFSEPNAIADAFIIATATSRRHGQGLADAVASAYREKGYGRPRMEGYETAQWILIDNSDIIIHIFQEEARDLYKLEDLCAHASSRENP